MAAAFPENRDVSPLAGLRETHSFSVGCEIQGLAEDTQRQCLVVRTKDKSSPIQVYDYNGQLREKLGGDIEGLANDAVNGNISLDTKRSLYLCPVEGTLVLIDRAGKPTATVKVGSKPCGISYSEEEDVYVVSDYSTHKVYVIDATNHQIVTEFGGSGSKGDLNYSYNVYVGHVTGISQPVIVVREHGNHCVNILNLRGHHIKTFGSRSRRGGAQLDGPRGVTTDPAGRIVICDRNHNRVVAFWEENNQDQWRCLVDSKQLKDKYPRHVSCDPQTRVLAVGFNNGLIQVFK